MAPTLVMQHLKHGLGMETDSQGISTMKASLATNGTDYSSFSSSYYYYSRHIDAFNHPVDC